MGISIRENVVPAGVMVLKDDGTVPTGYTNQCSYSCNFLIDVPDACTNPGACVGNANHTHDTQGCHTHCCQTGSTSHTHNVTFNATASVGPLFSPPSHTVSAAGHTHTLASGSNSPSVTSTTSNGSHTHNAICHNPVHRTFRLLKKSSSNISLHDSVIPPCTFTIWSKPFACIPTHFVEDTNLYTRLVKVDSACPGTNAGTNCHTHASCAHSHCVTLASHNHSFSGTVTDGGAVNAKWNPNTFSSVGHSHNVGSGSIANATHVGASSCPTHTHDTLSLKPLSMEVTLLKTNSVSMRQHVVPQGTNVIWDCTLASIPSGYALADGTLGTTNFLNKYITGVPNACTCPGCCTGSHTHQHNSLCHSHTTTFGSTHSVSGISSGATGTTNATTCSSSGALNGHTHTFTGQNNSCITLTSDCKAHQHSSLDHKPVSKTIAVIEKI